MSCMSLSSILEKMQQNCIKARSCHSCNMSELRGNRCLFLELRNTLKKTNVCITQDKILEV